MDSDNKYIQYNLLKTHLNLIAFTTTKETLKNRNPRFTGDNEDLFANNRKELASILSIDSNQMVFPRQTHTGRVFEIDRIPDSEINETDALITNKQGICLCVQTADCVPLLLYDPVGKVISAVHSGWRGTVKKIVQRAIQKMVSNYKSCTNDILVSIGPSISKEAYEVEEEVVHEVRNTIPNFDLTFRENGNGKFLLNLWEANRQILLEAGIQPGNIEIYGACSFRNDDVYYSARRDGIETGRNVSGIMLL